MANTIVRTNDPQMIAQTLFMNSSGFEESSLAFFSLLSVDSDSYEGGLSKEVKQ